MIGWILGLAVLSGVLYRMGGYGPPFNTKVRDFGCPLCAMPILWMLGYHNFLGLFLSYGLLFGAMTTYNKWLSILLYDDDDVHWPSWALTGIFYGLAIYPVIYFGGGLTPFFIRTGALGVLTAVWSELIGWDDLEEFGRGFIFIATFLFFLI